MPINIYNRRKELGLTLEEIAKSVGVTKGTVKKWENGYIKNMGRDKILALSDVLKVSPLDILKIEMEKSSYTKTLVTEEIHSSLSSILTPITQNISDSFAVVVIENELIYIDKNNSHFQNILNLLYL